MLQPITPPPLKLEAFIKCAIGIFYMILWLSNVRVFSIKINEYRNVDTYQRICHLLKKVRQYSYKKKILFHFHRLRNQDILLYFHIHLHQWNNLHLPIPFYMYNFLLLCHINLCFERYMCSWMHSSLRKYRGYILQHQNITQVLNPIL